MRSALITGAASGFGKALALRLAEEGYNLTVVDLDGNGLQNTVSRVKKLGAEARLVVADVCNNSQMAAAFLEHTLAFGCPDSVVLNAGIGEKFDVLEDEAFWWQKTLDVDLRAVLVGTMMATKEFLRSGKQGSIVAVASAAGVFPVPHTPIYAAAKAGVVHFVRSLAPRLAPQGICLSVVCPQFADTPLVQAMLREPDRARKVMGELYGSPLLTVDQVVEVIRQQLGKDATPGGVRLILQSGKVVDPFRPKPHNSHRDGTGASTKPLSTPGPLKKLLAQWARSAQGQDYGKIQVVKLSNDFREATTIVRCPLTQAVPPGHLLVRRVYAGVNASDINFTSGRYFNGGPKEAAGKLPYDAGFESVGVVAEVGPGVMDYQVGDAVATLANGFAEYDITLAKHSIPLPEPSAQMLTLLTSGLTASISLEQLGQLKAGETVLVTAAAGGTGQFAVQLARLVGCHVVATCSGGPKVEMLRQLGANRVIDYKHEDVRKVLLTEYPRGVDVVYESVGGDMFAACVDALAPKGRLIIIGMMSKYKDGWSKSNFPGLTEKLLWKNASLSGFFLPRYANLYRAHLWRLAQLLSQGQLRAEVDPQRFLGLENVAAAVEYLQSGRSKGKVVVQIPLRLPPLSISKM